MAFDDEYGAIVSPQEFDLELCLLFVLYYEVVLIVADADCLAYFLEINLGGPA